MPIRTACGGPSLTCEACPSTRLEELGSTHVRYTWFRCRECGHTQTKDLRSEEERFYDEEDR